MIREIRRQMVPIAVLGFACAISACGGGDSPRASGATTTTSTGAGATLRAIRARGTVKCGITMSAGFATPDNEGQWRGFDVDFCRALAVAIFDDPAKVTFVPYTMQQRFAGLQSGEVDALVNGTSLTISRVMGRGFHYGPIYLYDGQGFLVPKSSKVTKAVMLDGGTICVQQGTTTELNLADFARRNHITFKSVVMEESRGAVGALAAGRCDAISQDGAGIATTRTMLRNPGDYLELPDHISREPITPVLRFGDDQWLEIVNWVFRAPVEAEQLGLNQENVGQQATQSADPTTRRFLGLEPGVTGGFGLDAKWTYNVIAKVGNYADIFDRSLGPKTPLGMQRGLNKLWSDGGLMYSPPFR